MREEYPLTAWRLDGGRITPAHAGRIRTFSKPITIPWDHPRACGKNLIAVPMRGGFRGSPPRMREEFD